MKPALLALLLSLPFIRAGAQIRFGLEGGMNATTLVEKNFTHSHAKNIFRPGFNAGLSIEYRISRMFSLNTAIWLESKGTNGRYRSDTLTARIENPLLYLDLPVMLRAKTDLRSTAIFIEAGPYGGLGISGKASVRSSYLETSRNIRWGNSGKDDFRRFDYGIAIGAGLEWKGFFVEGDFLYGLANIFPVPGTNYNIQHRVAALRVGYSFMLNSP